VTDTGSTDNTVEIAKRYADKVLEFEWINDFSAARNFCTSHASNNWILSLDCDEYVNDIDIPTMRICMQKFPRYTGTIRLKNLTYDNGKERYGTDDVVRLYNKNYYTYDFPIHEQICSKDLSKRDEEIRCFLIPAEVIHHGYALGREEMEKKQQRNLEMLYAEYEKNPNNPYILFQIGQSETIIGNFQKSITYFEKALELNPSPELLYVQMAILGLAKAYTNVGAPADALALMNRYADKCKTAKFVFTQAAVYIDNNQPLKALLCYIKATTMPDADTLGENLKDCYESIIALYHNMGNDEMAQMFVKKYEECVAEKERVINA
jgi:glycosyltransferase involved in cell wall biosynthesis